MSQDKNQLTASAYMEMDKGHQRLAWNELSKERQSTFGDEVNSERASRREIRDNAANSEAQYKVNAEGDQYMVRNEGTNSEEWHKHYNKNLGRTGQGHERGDGNRPGGVSDEQHERAIRMANQGVSFNAEDQRQMADGSHDNYDPWNFSDDDNNDSGSGDDSEASRGQAKERSQNYQMQYKQQQPRTSFGLGEDNKPSYQKYQTNTDKTNANKFDPNQRSNLQDFNRPSY